MTAVWRSATRYSPLLLVILAWETMVRVPIPFRDPARPLLSPDFLPPFSEVARTTWELTFGPLVEPLLGVAAAAGPELGPLIGDAGISLWRGGVAFALAVVFEVVLGVGMARIRSVELGIRPLVTLWYPVPVPALFPILALIIKLGDQLQISIILLGSVLPVIVASFNAARGVDHFLVWSALNMGTSPSRILWKIVLPAALPEILSGIRVTLAIAFVLLVASEQLAARGGIGQFTLLAGENGYYSVMIAGILTIGLLCFVADRLYLMGMRRILSWREEEGA